MSYKMYAQKFCYWHQLKSFHMLPSAYCVLNISRKQMSPLTLTLIRHYIPIYNVCVCTIYHIYMAHYRKDYALKCKLLTLGHGRCPGIWNAHWPECQGGGVLYPSLIPCILQQATAPVVSASVSSSIK